MAIKGDKIDALKYQHFAKVTVKPFSSFPIDMLRYDRCTPNRQLDSSQINASFEQRDKPIIVVVRCISENAKEPWTTDRWKSFGAEIEPVTQGDTYKIQREVEASINAPHGAAKPE